MADDKDAFEKIDFEQCASNARLTDCEFEQSGSDETDCELESSGLDETLTDNEVSSGLTTNRSASESSTSGMASSTVQVNAVQPESPTDEITSNESSSEEQQLEPKSASMAKRDSSGINNEENVQEMIHPINQTNSTGEEQVAKTDLEDSICPVLSECECECKCECKCECVPEDIQDKWAGRLAVLAFVLMAAFVLFFQMSFLSKIYGQNSFMNEEIRDLKANYYKASAQVEALTTSNDALLKFMVKQLVKDSERNATTQFGDLLGFLDADKRGKFGEVFRCNGLSWQLLLQRPIKHDDYVGVFLCHHITDFFGYNFHNWSANLTFNLTLVNHVAKEKSKTKETSYTYKKTLVSVDRCFGWHNFISIHDLYSGFVKGDSLEFEVKFKSLDVDLV